MQTFIDFLGIKNFIPHGFCLSWLDSFLKIFIAIIFMVTAIVMLRIIPLALKKLPSAKQLQIEINERNLAESIQKETSELLQRITENLPGVVYQFRLNPDGSSCFPYASSAIQDIYHVTPEEVKESAEKVFAILHPDDYERIVISVTESAKNLTPWLQEYRTRFEDGSECWLLGNALPQREADGSTLWHGFISDISERKQVEAAFKKESDKSLALLRNSSDGIHILNHHGNIIECSDSFCTMLGYDREEVIGMHVSQWDAGIPESELMNTVNAQFQQITRNQFESRHRRKDGTIYDVELSGCRIEFDGEWVLFNSARDITERKQIEHNLRESEKRLNEIIDLMPIAVFIKDSHSRMMIMNKACENQWGIPISELQNTTGSHIFPAEQMEVFLAADKKVFVEGKTFELEELIWNAELQANRIVHTYKKPVFNETGEPDYLIGISVDITEEKQHEKALLESEFRWKFAVEGSGDGLWDWYIPSRRVFFSKRWKEMIGYTEDEIENIFVEWENRIHPDDKARVFATVQDYLDEKTDIYICEHRLQTKESDYKWIMARGMVVERDNEGKPLRMIGTHTDVTERKKMETELKDSEQKLRQSEAFIASVLDSLTSHIAVLDEHGIIVSVNRAWRQFGERNALPKENNNQLGSNYLNTCSRCIDETNDDEVKTIHDGILQVLRRENDYFCCEYPCHSADEKRWFLMNVSPLQGENGGVVISHENITNRKEIELELARSNADLEQFAYAVSHDMRQPLRMVTSYLSLLEKALGTQLDEDTRQFLTFALDGAKRMDAMILSLLDYSRVGKNSEILKVVSTRTAVDEAILFLKPALESCGGRIELSGDWVDLVASRDELTRLFQNLIGNALKYHDENKPPVVEVWAFIRANKFRVEVRDNGIGINPSQIDRLFKVFSRLQARGRFEGTGVGLALCRKIVEHHGGEIGVTSEGEGLGCTFWFELPFDNKKHSLDA